MQPLLIAGMHRSGTSVLTSVLEDLGLFVGRRLEENSEATFFLQLNNWLLRQAGGAWDHPEPFERFLAHDGLVAARAAELAQILRMPRAIEFMGVKDYLRLGDVARLDRPWGWKDPRTTFTLPVWERLFPGARLLVIHRHGADVARSLNVRARRLCDELTSRPAVLPRWSWRLPVSNNSWNRCLDLEESMRLWERYSATTEVHAARMGERALVLRYETLLARPVEEMTRVATFAGLSPSIADVEHAVSRLVREKSFNYRESPPLVALADRHRTSLAAFGY